MRGGDVSIGSTYILDLANSVSYRFKNHDTLRTKFPFHGFIPYLVAGKIYKYRDLKSFQSDLSQLIIREGAGEVHDSTPIRLVTILPIPVADLAIRTKNLDPIRQYEQIFLQQKRIPNAGQPINVKEAKVPIIA